MNNNPMTRKNQISYKSLLTWRLFGNDFAQENLMLKCDIDEHDNSRVPDLLLRNMRLENKYFHAHSGAQETTRQADDKRKIWQKKVKNHNCCLMISNIHVFWKHYGRRALNFLYKSCFSKAHVNN